MSLDKTVIEEKLAKLAQAIQLLEKYKKVSREDFLVDFTVNSAAQFNLALGIEIIVDIGNHILGEAYQVHPKEYAEVIEALGEYEIVPKELAKGNIEMAKFRNRIIHHYGAVDMGLVYENLQKAPDVFRQFARAFSEFLERQDAKPKEG